MVAIIIGQLTGLARGMIVANRFGASAELDAFLAANRVSETLFLLVAGGALSSAFIPTFAGFLAKKDWGAGWRLASSIANLLTLTLSVLAISGATLAPQIVRYALAPGFSADPELFALTVSLLRIQLVSTVLFGLGGLVVGILNANQVFLIPALTPAFYQLGIIFGAMILSPIMGVYGLAWGVVIGAILYLLLQIPPLTRLISTHRIHLLHQQKYIFNLGLKDPAVREVIFLMGPRLLGVAVVQLNFWVNTWLASHMAEGSLTGLYYGFSMMLMAQAAIAQSVAIAAMPTFSTQHALGQIDELRTALSSSLRAVILLALPASIGLILLRVPLTSLLYQRGQFDERAVQLVTWSLLWYAAGLVGHSIMEVLTRAYYAQHDTRTPVVIGTGAMLLNVVFSLVFSRFFLRLGWMPHGGLALANSLATALEASLLFVVMRTRIHGIEGGSLLRGFWAAALAGMGLLMSLIIWMRLTVDQPVALTAIGGVVVGGMIYLAVIWVLRVPELTLIISAISRRINPR